MTVLNKRQQIQEKIEKDGTLSVTKEFTSPSNKYRLVLDSYSFGNNTWNFVKASLYDSNACLLFEVYRNYSSFPFSWVESHPNGHDYFVCGYDYQSQTILELDTGKRTDYTPTEASKGVGFCWASHKPSPDKTLLAVEGCYWACPYEVVIYDFSNPMNLPYKELHREWNYHNFGGWADDSKSCKIGRYYDVVNSGPFKGKKEDDLSIEELIQVEKYAQNQNLNEDDLYDEVFEEGFIWNR